MTQAPAQASFTSTNTQPSAIDDLTRVFNTAIIATHAASLRDFSSELYELVQSPAFRAILHSIRQVAHQEGFNEREAAELVINTFRKADKLWSEYVFQEGVDRLKKQSH